MTFQKYFQKNESFKAVQRKFIQFEQKRDAAMRSGLIQDEVGSDLYSTNLALQAEYDELELELDDIDKTNDALRATIMAKYEQKADFVNAIFDTV